MAADSNSVVVWFVRPVSGQDRSTGDTFRADRHAVFAERVHQDGNETVFIDAQGEIVARWPTPLIVRVVWPDPLGTPSSSTEHKPITLAERKRKNPAAYDAWTDEEEGVLLELDNAGRTVGQISKAMGRSPGAIRSRLRRLGLDG